MTIGRRNTVKAVGAFYVDDHAAFAIGSNNMVQDTMNGDKSTGTLNAYAIGFNNSINGSTDLVAGTGNKLKGYNNVILGQENEVRLGSSVVIGKQNTSTDNNSIGIEIGNENAIEATNQIAIGFTNNSQQKRTNLIRIGTYLRDRADGGNSGNVIIGNDNNPNSITQSTVFVLGAGGYQSAMNQIRAEKNDGIYVAGAYHNGGADYAEMHEWLDQNVDNEDRRGYFVTTIGDKIKIVNSGDYILGIVSANPAILGNNDECWSNIYERDEFGSLVYEDIEIIDEQGNLQTVAEPKLNPAYDENREYISRDKRKEWAAVGWLGRLVVRDDGTSEVNGYCKCGNGGIATACDRNDEGSCRVIERINDNLIKVILK